MLCLPVLSILPGRRGACGGSGIGGSVLLGAIATPELWACAASRE